MKVIAIAAAALTLAAAAPVNAQQFVAPPRTIADITAILDQEKPDPRRVRATRIRANAQPPGGIGTAEMARFYYTRCRANEALGEFRKAIADCQQAEQLGRGSLSVNELSRLRQGLALQYNSIGDPKKALVVLLQLARETNVNGTQGWGFNANRHIVENYVLLGDFNQAEAYVRRNQVLLREAKGWSSFTGYRRASFNADVEQGQAHLFEARGQFREAEQAFKRAETFRREALSLNDPAPPGQLEGAIDEVVAMQGRMKARQGRIAEGEADVRRALLNRLKANGKYNLGTNKMVAQLANLLVEQGRFAEADQLTRVQIDVQKTLDVPQDSQIYANSLSQLASILNLLGRWNDAAAVYAELEAATKGWEPARREGLQLNSEHIATLYNTNNLQAGIAAAERLLARQKQRYGEQHVDTALSRGLLGIGFSKSGRDADALRELKLAVPILMARSRETDDEDATTAAAREQRAQIVVESYIALLARMGPAAGVDPATESFRLADAVRSRSVQRALAASSARSTAANPALAELVRKTQDLEKQIGAQLGLLNNVLTMPPAERDDRALKTLQADIEKMRNARDAAKKELAGKFPNYASLVEPAPPAADDVRAVMKPNEAFLSFYFGRDASFVWAVGKSGPIAFAAINATAGDIDKKVQTLREALEPNATTISDIPPFDTALAHELYTLLLKPVEAGWKGASNLIVATNGALGLLPLGLLTTATAEVNAAAEPIFAGYRNVPWLARTHAVTLVPSAAALRTLRQLPPGSNKREQMIGFGDPLFSQQQANALVQMPEIATRGLPLQRRNAPQTMGIDSAQLALLPRLPDTADELKSIAIALHADPSKALHLGKAANEDTVKNTDLTKFKIIVFATHGLVPGELDGLHQPALALSAPDVAGVPGDGLLTMEEILALKLDADWVVLSACNTGAGAGAGAEAASGLGQAFFYAGTRAILVTNWSVHSASARELVSDLFARQTADPKLTRGEALRQASIALLDGPGFKDAGGNTLFSYAHPLFWAPYTIIGDGD
jgi:CHAT domain-containing protein/tetratricopeptide (TPR) repeat protein